MSVAPASARAALGPDYGVGEKLEAGAGKESLKDPLLSNRKNPTM
jgi:hypothetical protein